MRLGKKLNGTVERCLGYKDVRIVGLGNPIAEI